MNCQTGLLVMVLGALSACGGGTPYASHVERTTTAANQPVADSVAEPPAPAVDDGLAQVIWRLADARDAKGARIAAIRAKPGVPLSLMFANGRIQVRNACNHIGGEYRLGESGAFAIDKLQRTEKLCPDKAEMAAEEALYVVLENISSIELPENGSGRLRIADAQGNVLSFAAIPVPGR